MFSDSAPQMWGFAAVSLVLYVEYLWGWKEKARCTLGNCDGSFSQLPHFLQTDYLLLFSDFGDIPPVPAQDIINTLKQGYLEKKRKGTAASRYPESSACFSYLGC